MVKFVRTVSVWILWIYTAEGILFAGVSAWGAVRGIFEIPNVGGGTIDGETTPILDGIGRFLLVVGIVVLVSVIFIAAGEIFLLRKNFTKAIQNNSFKYFGTMSKIALVCGAVNFVYSLIMTFIISIITDFLTIWEFLTGLIFVTFVVNIIMEILSGINLAFSNKCVQNGL